MVELHSFQASNNKPMVILSDIFNSLRNEMTFFQKFCRNMIFATNNWCQNDFYVLETLTSSGKIIPAAGSFGVETPDKSLPLDVGTGLHTARI